MAMSVLAATRMGLFTLRKEGDSWKVAQAAFLGDHVCIVLHDTRDGTTYAALDHGHFGGKVHRCAAGQSWEECAVPVYPAKPEEEVDLDPWTKAPRAWKLNKIWALEAGHTSQPGVLWCGTLPGGLFRSKDRAASWELIRPLWDHPARKEWFGGGAELPGIHSVCVDPRDGRRVTVGVSCGGVWLTEDDGETWQARAQGMWAAYMPPERREDPIIQDPHCVVQCRARPECLWAQHHNGVFRTTDGGLSWREVKDVQPSVFGFPVAVHPHDPETAWFVPAVNDEKRIPVGGKVAVARTRDGGGSFEVLTRGLPQDHAYDITYRHALDVDSEGRCLAFGTTTGSLWISEDQGDSWQAVSHLPPVYCVRFQETH